VDKAKWREEGVGAAISISTRFCSSRGGSRAESGLQPGSGAITMLRSGQTSRRGYLELDCGLKNASAPSHEALDGSGVDKSC
jgi:hypothetical protein